MDTLLDLKYRTENGKAVITLFGVPKDKTKDKEEEEVRDFQPYFYALPVESVANLKEEIDSAGFAGVQKLEVV
jgi:hypothetical protein